jgi:hypothetical protein
LHVYCWWYIQFYPKISPLSLLDFYDATHIGQTIPFPHELVDLYHLLTYTTFLMFKLQYSSVQASFFW